ncbi:MAG: DNA repair protein RecO [Calditrichaeota bacterium]|nr:MAG: DNA repair protein RecO [Calditrichota bacterium]
MAIQKIKALILRSVNFHETSRILTVFTEEYGKITLIAKGVRKSKSQLIGILEPTNIIQAIIYKKPNRDIYTLTQAELLTSLTKLKQDLKKLYLGYAILETILKLTETEDESPELFKLAANSLFFLNKSGNNNWNQLFFFWFEFLKLSGYQMNFFNCFRCEKVFDNGYKWRFSKFDGGILCDNHNTSANIPIITKNAILAIQKIKTSKLQSVTSFEIANSTALEVTKHIELYFQEHFENFVGWNSTKQLSEVLREMQKNPVKEKIQIDN